MPLSTAVRAADCKAGGLVEGALLFPGGFSSCSTLGPGGGSTLWLRSSKRRPQMAQTYLSGPSRGWMVQHPCGAVSNHGYKAVF